MGKIGRWAGALAVAVVAGTVVCTAGEASAAIIKTKISLAELKKVYNLSSIRRLIDPAPRDGVSFYLRGPGRRGALAGNNGKPNLAKSFVVFRVNTKQVPQRIWTIGLADVVFDRSARPRKPWWPVVRVACALRGTSSAGIRSVTCGRRSVSPT